MGAVRFLSPPRERNPRQRFCAGAKVMSENTIAKMTMRQAEEEMACYRKIYPIVRLLDQKTIEEDPLLLPLAGGSPLHPVHRAGGTALQRAEIQAGACWLPDLPGHGPLCGSGRHPLYYGDDPAAGAGQRRPLPRGQAPVHRRADRHV